MNRIRRAGLVRSAKGRRGTIAALIAGIALLTPGGPSAEPVAVHHMEGLGHGFLALRSEAGTLLASGDQTQLAQGDRVTQLPR